MKHAGNELLDASVALRHLADAVGQKWYRMLADDCTGLGHIHDMWHDMYLDMEAIVCLEKYIADHTEGGCTGSDFRPVLGFEAYNEKEKKNDE